MLTIKLGLTKTYNAFHCSELVVENENLQPLSNPDTKSKTSKRQPSQRSIQPMETSAKNRRYDTVRRSRGADQSLASLTCRNGRCRC